MYGKFVTVYGIDVWVNCCPNTPEQELKRIARAILQDKIFYHINLN